VPPSHREGEMLSHGLAKDYSVGIVILEGQHIFARFAFVLYFADFREKFFHFYVSLLFKSL
jgi:hypothetical protein